MGFPSDLDEKTEQSDCDHQWKYHRTTTSQGNAVTVRECTKCGYNEVV